MKDENKTLNPKIEISFQQYVLKLTLLIKIDLINVISILNKTGEIIAK